MAFGSSTGFGSGFGSSSNNQQSNSTFGGFGSGNTGSGFGQQNSTGFGATSNTNAGGGLFGGAGGGAFGSSNTSAFGANRSSFGGGTTTTGGGLFGSNTATTGGSTFGGFGSTTNNASSGFGSGTSTTSGLFGGGAAKPTGFGSTTSGGGLFGASNTSNTTNTTSAFGTGSNQSTGIFGNQNNAECQGTGSTPFQPFTEKEQNSNATNQFQSITFMQPYQKWSFEELRQADYNQGRRFGNQSGQPGAFGQTPFGGFGTNNQSNSTFGASTGGGGGGLFGQNNTTTSSTPFGSNTQTTGGFGSTGLFGGSKPVGTGLFGNTAASTQQSSGGIFGTSGNTGFGAQQNTGIGNNQTGGGFFNNNQNDQNKANPFGQPNQTTGGSIFGSTSNTGGFGTGNAGGGLFGGQNQTQQNQGSSIFSNNQTQNNQGSLFSGTGGFGNTNNNQQQAAKPSLFGTSNSTGLLGNNQNNQGQPGGLFNTNNTNTGGGLFNNSKPLPGNSLFGNTQSTTNNAGGLFSNQQNAQPNQGSSLFGGQNKSLFGNNNNAGTSLFGQNQQNQNQGGSLFGNTNQTAGGSIFGTSNVQNQGSLFGGSQQNVLQPPQALTTSINDSTPYGSSSIFSGLPPPPQSNVGPVATPIAAGQKTRKPAVLPQYKINPAMSSRLVTPQKRNGFGFSYSTYGTPSSVSSVNSTPGTFNNSLLGGSITRSLGKSLSTSNLRQNFDGETSSILSPGAFSANSSRFSGSGSMKRLTIDRSLRNDLFGATPLSLPSPEKNDAAKSAGVLKKKVSFDSSTVGGSSGSVLNNNALNNPSPDREAEPTLPAPNGGLGESSRLNSRANGSRPLPSTNTPEMSQVRGNELAIVHEDESPEPSTSEALSRPRQPLDQTDPEPGEYWIEPPLSELKKMPRNQLKHLSDVRIGRERCGYCAFNEPVDLTTVDLNNIFDHVARIGIRSLTIYPKDVRKAPVGKGLNVPSTIVLENSWPRQRDRKTPSYETSGPRFNKHVERLMKVSGTEFVEYNKETGEWVFKVPHFTTYALDYDDYDEPSELEALQSSTLSELPYTPTPISKLKVKSARMPNETSLLSEVTDSEVSIAPDDTFEFKKKSKLLPGAFDDLPAFDADQDSDEADGRNGQSFLGHGSASFSENEEDEPSESDQDNQANDQSFVVRDGEMDMAGTFPEQQEPNNFDISRSFFGVGALDNNGPATPHLLDMGDFEQQLQRTISPRKQDRQALRESQRLLFRNDSDADEQLETRNQLKDAQDTGEIATSIEMMDTLFGAEAVRKSVGSAKKRVTVETRSESTSSKESATLNQREINEKENLPPFNSFKPCWGSGGSVIIQSLRPPTRKLSKRRHLRSIRALSEGREIKVVKLPVSQDITQENFIKQRSRASISVQDGVPFAQSNDTPFDAEFVGITFAHQHEEQAWELASILFDDYEDDISNGIPPEELKEHDHRIRKERLSLFWSQLCRREATAAVSAATTPEERAIAYLSMNYVAEACRSLIDAKDFRLATLVAQLEGGSDPQMHEGIAKQIEVWRTNNFLSEMTDSIRALYELCAGNTCECEGKKGPIEDRAKTFTISQRFKLDWKRAFGMKLWYGITADEPLETAVQDFLKDIEDEKETADLRPWFLSPNSEITLAWTDPHPEQRHDVLLGILRLFAQGKAGLETAHPALAEVVSPENATGNPLSHRFSFDLYYGLAQRLPNYLDYQDADSLALAFAAELEDADQWLWSVFALLHLSDPDARMVAIQNIVARHAASIPNEDDGDDVTPMDVEQQGEQRGNGNDNASSNNGSGVLSVLCDQLHIPRAWAWQAKALHARAVERDYAAAVTFLLRAGDRDTAHEQFCTEVAPLCVVERDYGLLTEMLDMFTKNESKSSSHSHPRSLPKDWRTGGACYTDYLELVERGKSMNAAEKTKLLARLAAALGDMAGKQQGRGGHRHGGRERGHGGDRFMQKVAVHEMSAVVGDAILKDGDKFEKNEASVLQLPLTTETRRSKTRQISLDYYQRVMAMGN